MRVTLPRGNGGRSQCVSRPSGGRLRRAPASLPSEVSAPEIAPLGNRYHIPAAEVRRMMEEHQLNPQELLGALVNSALTLARPPISQFRVGAVGMGTNNDVYIGVNLEFKMMPLNQSVHAEQFLITNALLHRESALPLVAISAAPCGHCRQFMSELSCAASMDLIFPSRATRGRYSQYKLDELLPVRFGPSDLLDDGHPLLLEPQHHNLEYVNPLELEVKRLLKPKQDKLSIKEEDLVKLCEVAFDFAKKSYAPYTRCPSGVALLTSSGEIYGGSYAESAAYNPSMLPLQAALISALVGGMKSYKEVVHVVLVERQRGLVSMNHMTRQLQRRLNYLGDTSVINVQYKQPEVRSRSLE